MTRERPTRVLYSYEHTFPWPPGFESGYDKVLDVEDLPPTARRALERAIDEDENPDDYEDPTGLDGLYNSFCQWVFPGRKNLYIWFWIRPVDERTR